MRELNNAELINANDVYLNFLFELLGDKCQLSCVVFSLFHLIKAQKDLIRRSGSLPQQNNRLSKKISEFIIANGVVLGIAELNNVN